MALGVRFVEVESICREMKSQATVYQKRNTDVLTDSQKAKLQVLQDAMKLAPIISEAQGGNLIEGLTYAPLFFTGTSGSTSGFMAGGAIGPANGCYLPNSWIQTGDFRSAPSSGNAVPANRISGATPPPRNRAATRWFDTTKFVETPGRGNQR